MLFLVIADWRFVVFQLLFTMTTWGFDKYLSVVYLLFIH